MNNKKLKPVFISSWESPGLMEYFSIISGKVLYLKYFLLAGKEIPFSFFIIIKNINYSIIYLAVLFFCFQCINISIRS